MNFTVKLEETLDNLAAAIFHMNRRQGAAEELIVKSSAGIADLRRMMSSRPDDSEVCSLLASEMEDAINGGQTQELNELITQFNQTLEGYAASRGGTVMQSSV